MTPPTITLGGLPCNVVLPFIPAPRHDVVSCRSPVAVGSNLAVVVVVSGQVRKQCLGAQADMGMPSLVGIEQVSSFASTPVAWSYDPPVVSSISPASGPTAGAILTNDTSDGVNYALGPPIVCTVKGTNLGANPAAGTLSFLPSIIIPNSSILTWNHTTVSFYMPQGSGSLSNLPVQALIGGQDSTLSSAIPGVTFTYDAPSVLRVTRFDKAASLCAPIQRCYSYAVGLGNATAEACKPEPQGCFGTEVRGGFMLQRIPREEDPTHTHAQGKYSVAIIGESFGSSAQPNVVTIDGNPCSLVSAHSHNLIVCTAPQVRRRRDPVPPALVFCTCLCPSSPRDCVQHPRRSTPPP